MAKSSLYNKVLEIKSLRDNTITAYNLRAGINVFGVNGNYTNGANITSQDVVSGKIGYANGSTITGGLREYTSETIPIPVSVSHNEQGQNVVGTYYNTVAIVENSKNVRVGDGVIRNLATFNIPYNTLSRLLNIQPMDIKKDKTILDVTGQYDASTEFSGIKMDPVKPSASSTPLTQSITDISGLDMTEGTNLYRYFYGLYNVKSISNISTPNVTNMWSMFQDCMSLASINSVNFYNSSQTKLNTTLMFSGCTNLKSIPNTVRFPKELNYCDSMFQNCRNLTDINTDININVTSVQSMFSGCTNLQNIKSLNIIARDVVSMFYDCTNLVDVSNVHFFNNSINASSMLYGCGNLNVSTLNMSDINVYNAYYMFYGCRQLNKTQLVTFLNTLNKIIICNGAFGKTGINSVLNSSDFNANKVIFSNNLTSLYSNCNNITSVNMDDIAYLSNPYKDLSYLFQGCANLQSVTANNGIKAAYVHGMFAGCTNLKTVDINLNAVNTVYNMFKNCTNLTTVNFMEGSSFNIDSVYGYNMFSECTNLTKIDGLMSLFNNIRIYNSYDMFRNCHNLNMTGELVFNVYGNISAMFANCLNLTANITISNYNQYVSRHYNTATNAFYNVGSAKIDMNWYGSNNSILRTSPLFYYCNNLKYSTINFDGINTDVNCYPTSVYYNCQNLYDLTARVMYNAKRVSFNQYAYYTTISNQLYIDLGNYAKEFIGLAPVSYSNIDTLRIDGINMQSNICANIGYLMSNCNNINNIILNVSPDTKIDWLKLYGCRNISNNALDSIIGTVATHTINNMSTYMINDVPRVEAIFMYCNISEEILSNLPNTSKLLANGWKLMNNS